MAKSSRFAEQPRVVLPGSEKAAAPTAVTQKPTPPRSKLTVSVIVKRKQPLKINRRGGRASGPVRVTRAEFKKQHAADPAAITLVRAFARKFNLKVELDPTSVARRTIRLTGAVADMQRAFGVVLEQKTIDGVEYRVREGGIYLPASLIDSVVAVLGLDNRPQANPHFRIRQPHAVSTSYTPVQVAHAYRFPPQATGVGQTIGIIELGGGYRQTDLTAYFKSLGLAAPAVTTVSVEGGKNSSSNANGADSEVMLDIEVSAAVAPGAKVAVYFAPNTDQGFIDAITTAVHDTTDKPSVISISWGGPESSWTQQSLAALDAACQSAAALGSSITVATDENVTFEPGGNLNVSRSNEAPCSSSVILTSPSEA
jgi:kumamolisin